MAADRGEFLVFGMDSSSNPLNDAGKATKAEAEYGPGGRDHCGICRFFIVVHRQLTPGACTKVRGSIWPQDWCKFYQHEGINNRVV